MVNEDGTLDKQDVTKELQVISDMLTATQWDESERIISLGTQLLHIGRHSRMMQDSEVV